MSQDIIERDCCGKAALYDELRAEIERLTARLAEWENSFVSPPLVKAQAEIEQLRAESDISDALLADAKAKIERLEAALANARTLILAAPLYMHDLGRGRNDWIRDADRFVDALDQQAGHSPEADR